LSNKTETCCHNKILIFIHRCVLTVITLKHFVFMCKFITLEFLSAVVKLAVAIFCDVTR